MAERPRKNFARFPKTNPYFLVRCDSYDDLKSRLDPFAEKMLEIEEDLHKYPEKFRDAWNKIV